TQRATATDLRVVARALVRELDLTREEVGYLIGDDPESPRVTSLFERPGSTLPPPEPVSTSNYDGSFGGPSTPSPGAGAAKKGQRSLSEFGA
ncbi:MAG: hypothetical protein L3K02_07275, partial [Thermoplasmata archaeon]|nr:hypothetical protein [Thermoplasmata archaeon]